MSEMAKSEPQEPAAAKGGGCSKPEEDFVLRFNLRVKASTMLYPHQREGIQMGVEFAHKRNGGKYLAMTWELGKTMQVGFPLQECVA